MALLNRASRLPLGNNGNAGIPVPPEGGTPARIQLHPRAAGDGVGEDRFVAVFDLRPGGQAAGEAGDLDVGGDEGNFLLDVECGAVAFHGGVGGEDELADLRGRTIGSGLEAVEELGDGEVAGGDVFEGGDAAQED